MCSSDLNLGETGIDSDFLSCRPWRYPKNAKHRAESRSPCRADSIIRSWGGQPDNEMLQRDDRAFRTLWYERHGVE